jgi:hypothetical protein
LPDPLEGYLEDHLVLDPAYFAEWGSVGGALYGVAHPFWQIGPCTAGSTQSAGAPGCGGWERRCIREGGACRAQRGHDLYG